MEFSQNYGIIFHGSIHYTVMKMDELKLYTYTNTTYVEQKKTTDSFPQTPTKLYCLGINI